MISHYLETLFKTEVQEKYQTEIINLTLITPEVLLLQN